MINEKLFYQLTLMYVKAAHDARGQTRKVSGDPYWVHPVGVAEIVSRYTDDQATIQGALLHDVIEDTCIIRDHLVEAFGQEVGDIVQGCSDPQQPEPNIPRSVRKRINREHAARQNAKVQNIKVADSVYNLLDMEGMDIDFCLMYLHEKEAMISEMKLANTNLLAYAYTVIDILKEKYNV